MTLEEVFEKNNKEYLKFDRIANPISQRKDVCAFVLLDKLIPDKGDMVTAAEHDEIYLDTDCYKLAEVATEDDIIFLIRCGIRYDSENVSLKMFT